MQKSTLTEKLPNPNQFARNLQRCKEVGSYLHSGTKE